jgi:hypothetical protein
MYIAIYTQTSFQSQRDCMFIENVIFQPRSTPSESYKIRIVFSINI